MRVAFSTNHFSSITVSLLLRTPIVLTGPSLTAAEWDRVPEDLKAQYDPKMPDPNNAMQYVLENPALVVDAIQSALTDRTPSM